MMRRAGLRILLMNDPDAEGHIQRVIDHAAAKIAQAMNSRTCRAILPSIRGNPPGILTVNNTNADRYYRDVPVSSFKCADTQRLFEGERVRRFVNVETAAMRKLAMLNRAGKLDDLRVPPGDRLETLKGRRAGQHGIRVNDRFRVCFIWTAEGPKDVEIVDCH